ncbi:MAG: ABC transporter permease [Thiobacillaceae bacterium]|jgi:putative ABC transport system permease protein
MYWLAMKMLFHQKMRLLITLIGITISVVLALVEVAIYLGMMGNATSVLRHTDGDIWVASKNVQSFDFALPFPSQRIDTVRGLQQVEWAEKILLNYGFIKLANGGREQVQFIGYNPDTGVGGPWNLIEGSPTDVKGGRYMIIDKTSEQRLGHLQTGTRWEVTFIREHPFKLVGLSEGIKSFTTIPLVFLSYNEMNRMFAEAGWSDLTCYIVVKLRNPADQDAVVHYLRDKLKDNDVFTRDEFIRKTIMYWTVQTGMGMAFFITAALALIIGGTIVGQTIYASTLEHLREYGTLKAIGARNQEIDQAIFAQAGFSAVAGYLSGVIVVLLMRSGIESAGVPLYLSPTLFAGLFVSIFSMCLASAWFSVARVHRLDPVSVFKA